MDDAESLRNKLLVNEYSFLRKETIPKISDIQAKYRETAGQVRAKVRVKLKIRFK